MPFVSSDPGVYRLFVFGVVVGDVDERHCTFCSCTAVVPWIIAPVDPCSACAVNLGNPEKMLGMKTKAPTNSIAPIITQLVFIFSPFFLTIDGTERSSSVNYPHSINGQP